jgi:transposase
MQTISRLELNLQAAVATIARLEARVVQLEVELAKAKKDSSTSSKPPSSDIVKPPKPPPPKGKKKRSRGGQPDHARHERKPFPPDEIDEVKEYRLTHCPDCSTRLRQSDEAPRVIQQVELVERPLFVTEHRARAYWCRCCGMVCYGAIPREVRDAGLIGPRLTAFVAFLKGGCHASYSTVETVLSDVLDLRLSRGQIGKLIGKTAAALAGPYQELLDLLPCEEKLNVDETGHKDRGKLMWTWCFRAELFTLFRIDPSRGSDVLVEVLGKEFDGVLGCDYFGAYRKFMEDFDVVVQFCLAHLIREVKFLTTLTDKATRTYGERLLERLRALFRVIHRRDRMTEEQFQRALERERKKVLQVGKRAPDRIEAKKLARRFRKHGAAYFQFITTPGLQPTNNIAEQAIRFIVIDRRVTQGTGSPAGQRWSERIWTTMATCAQQGRSAFRFLESAIRAHVQGRAPPSLLPANP